MQLRMALYARWCSWSVRSLLFCLLCSYWPCVSVCLSAGMLSVLDFFHGATWRYENELKQGLGWVWAAYPELQVKGGREHANCRLTDRLTPNKHALFFWQPSMHMVWYGMVWYGGYPHTWWRGATMAVCMVWLMDNGSWDSMGWSRKKSSGREGMGSGKHQRKKVRHQLTWKKRVWRLPSLQPLPRVLQSPVLLFFFHQKTPKNAKKKKKKKNIETRDPICIPCTLRWVSVKWSWD